MNNLATAKTRGSAFQPGVYTPGYMLSPLRGWRLWNGWGCAPEGHEHVARRREPREISQVQETAWP